MSENSNSSNEAQYTMKTDEALAALGEVYYRGIGTPCDYHQAFRYYRKAADLGNPAALRRLGNCYEEGRGTEVDQEAALNCYESASAKGDALATLRLGDFYKDGFASFITKDNAKAANCYLAALQQAIQNMDAWGAADIYLRVGDIMREGIGVPKDLEKALEFYNAAADLYLQRMDSGDSDSEALMEQAEEGADFCADALGYPKDLGNEGFEA
ncbi:MAG: sel1 repeat family protein [Solobacterium sp.]|nr:sel1 repeat family protein [Solobacterium sp.]